MKTYKSDCWIDIPDYQIEDLPVTVDWCWENNGIGSYEYWGQKCFDEGENYIDVRDITPVFDREPKKGIQKKILKYIDDNYEKLCDKVAEYLYENQPINDEP
jgi:hypothetical protein